MERTNFSPDFYLVQSHQHWVKKLILDSITRDFSLIFACRVNCDLVFNQTTLKGKHYFSPLWFLIQKLEHNSGLNNDPQ